MNISWLSLDNKYIRLLFMSFVIILALIFVQDFADFLDENSDSTVKLGVNQHCNSASSICSASLINNGEFQRISFSIKSESTSGEGIPVFVTAVGFDFEGIQSISVSFMMHDEDIDSNLVLFEPDKSKHQAVPENWNAIVKLPVVSVKRKDWLAVVRLKSSQKEYLAEFPFHF
ncbi:MAG: hypothetical protein GY694_21365 [Gammaproteobacteria bacterium]|nr:hypothetical protein [Gammaproteobacteria bacterium]